MYESYWNLSEKPFEPVTDPNFYYPAPTHQAALLKLRYAIENRRAAALLTGGSGLGKSLLTTMIGSMIAESFQPFVDLSFPQMPVDQFVAYLADSLVGDEPNNPTSHLWRNVERIERFLADNSNQGRHAVVVINEAHLLADHDTLETIRLLSNFEAGGVPSLTLVLSAQVALLPVLDRTPQLEERLAVKCLLRPLTQTETAEYVDHRLQQAGATNSIFESDALATLWQLTGGNPRRINRLCDLALLVGFAEQQQTVTAGQLEALSQELLAVAPE